MSDLSFDTKSERELAALEAGTVGALLRSTGEALKPQAGFAVDLEARLRSNTMREPALARNEGKTEAAPYTGTYHSGERAASGRTVAHQGAGRGRLLKLASVGLGLAATIVLAFWLAGLFSDRLGGRVAGVTVAEFVPAGKVLHIDINATTVVTGTSADDPRRESGGGSSDLERWVGNENGRLVARTGDPSHQFSGYSQLLTADAFYDYKGDTNIYKYPYDLKYLTSLELEYPWLPVLSDLDTLDRALAVPNAHIVGDAELDGRTVTVVFARATTPLVRTSPDGSQWEEMVDRTFWIEKGTSRMVQVEFSVEVTSGEEIGFRYGGLHKLVKEELLERSALAEDYFTFEAPLWATIIESGAAGSSTPNAPTATVAGSPGGDAFVPAGKVRHMVKVGSQTTTDMTGKIATSQIHREEVWLAPGHNHYLMRTHVTIPNEIWTWIDGGSLYTYEPAKGSIVERSPYESVHQSSVIPNPEAITETLALSGAQSLGETTLRGRHALLIERSTLGVKYWIDLETNQLLQVEFSTTSGDGSNATIRNYIELDELVDRASLPADYFTFVPPPGTTVESSTLWIGDKAPDFGSNDVRTGQPVQLSSLTGKPVVINFWGEWCSPCKDAMPEMEKLYQENKDDVVFISVSYGPRDTEESIRSYLDKTGYEWLFLQDPDTLGLVNDVMEAYGASSLPAFYFIDRAGVVQVVSVGLPQEGALEANLAKIR